MGRPLILETTYLLDLEREMPVVTRNEGHFSRVPGLEVVTYGG